MNSDAFAELERKLSLAPPLEYRQFLGAFPDDLRAVLANCGAEDYLFDNPHSVMMRTLACRRGPFYDTEFPDDYLCIGEDGFGNYYCLDTSRNPAAVMFFDHESDEFELKAGSITEWWPMLVAEFKR